MTITLKNQKEWRNYKITADNGVEGRLQGWKGHTIDLSFNWITGQYDISCHPNEGVHFKSTDIENAELKMAALEQALILLRKLVKKREKSFKKEEISD